MSIVLNEDTEFFLLFARYILWPVRLWNTQFLEASRIPTAEVDCRIENRGGVSGELIAIRRRNCNGTVRKEG